MKNKRSSDFDDLSVTTLNHIISYIFTPFIKKCIISESGHGLKSGKSRERASYELLSFIYTVLMGENVQTVTIHKEVLLDEENINFGVPFLYTGYQKHESTINIDDI